MPLSTTGLRPSVYDSYIGSRCTGQERDQENGLDFFQACYYGAALGRFTLPPAYPLSTPLLYPAD